MTQEEIELLFRDLCARLPYGVKVQYSNQICNLVTINDDYTVLLLGEDGYKPNIEDDLFLDIENVKPYLRPMSSMTEEEEKQFQDINMYELPYTVEGLDWLNAHHFDYRGLINDNLALEAPEGMYNKLKK